MEDHSKLVAEFMGAKLEYLEYAGELYRGDFPKVGQDLLPLKQMEFHSSWDWLMPVVEKIEAERRTDGAHISRYWVRWVNYGYLHRCLITDTATGRVVAEGDSEESKIEATYRAVVEFIRWYNLNKQQ